MSGQEGAAWTSSAIDTARKMELSEPFPYQQFLLSDDNPYVAAELERRQGAKGPEQSGTWRSKYYDLLSSEGVRATEVQAPREFVESPWYKMLTTREQQGLRYAITVNRTKDTELVSVDTYQSIGRMLLGKDDVLSTILPSSRIFLLKERRLLLGAELNCL